MGLIAWRLSEEMTQRQARHEKCNVRAFDVAVVEMDFEVTTTSIKMPPGKPSAIINTKYAERLTACQQELFSFEVIALLILA